MHMNYSRNNTFPPASARRESGGSGFDGRFLAELEQEKRDKKADDLAREAYELRVGVEPESEEDMDICNDCGEPLTDDNKRSACVFCADVCKPCWETRGELVEGKIVSLASDEFEAIRKAMVGCPGTAKNLIDAAREKHLADCGIETDLPGSLDGGECP